MPIVDVINQLRNSGILPIEVLIFRPEDEYEAFIYQDNISQYINILTKINIKSVFVEIRKVMEEDFINYLDDEEAELFRRGSMVKIDEDGMIDLVALSPELAKYKQYIDQIMEIRIIAIIEGKELHLRIQEEWGAELNILFIRTGNILEEMIEAQEIEFEHHKKKHK